MKGVEFWKIACNKSPHGGGGGVGEEEIEAEKGARFTS